MSWWTFWAIVAAELLSFAAVITYIVKKDR